MSDKYQPREHDEIEVTLRGVARNGWAGSFFIMGTGPTAYHINPTNGCVVSVVKIEPPAFNPGDILKDKRFAGEWVVLTETGYWFEGMHYVIDEEGSGFAPDKYELVGRIG